MMKRLEFLISGALGSALAAPQTTLEVEVMEVLSSSSGSSALLCHPHVCQVYEIGEAGEF